MGEKYIRIDVSDVRAKLNSLQGTLSQQQQEKMVNRALVRTGKTVKTILKRELPKEYHVKPAQIGREVGYVHTQYTPGRMGCSIPITGVRGHIGDTGKFKARGGAHGWQALKYAGKRYKIKAKIVKDHVSVLPTAMSDNSGNAPFRNYDAPKLNGIAFVRRKKGKGSRLPITPIVSIGIPQMPLNRSMDDVQDAIMNKLEERLVHEHEVIMRRIVK